MVHITNAEVIQHDIIAFLDEYLENRKTPGPEPYRPASVESVSFNDDLDLYTIKCTDGTSVAVLIKTGFNMEEFMGQKPPHLKGVS